MKTPAPAKTLARALLPALLALSTAVHAQGITASAVTADLSAPDPAAAYWADIPAESVLLMAQPMVTPRPSAAFTPNVAVQAAHDGKWIAFRLKWKDTEASFAGRLHEFSDAVAIQFPMKAGATPPPVFMGAAGHPVHIYHWRAQYQRDVESGKPDIKELYPNLSIDAYPMDPHDPGTLGAIPQEMKDQFSPGIAVGNPQAFVKRGVDEIVAEGFATSSVMDLGGAAAKGTWENGEWTVVITRELNREGASVLQPGGKSFLAFAVWQGGLGEVGSRKCVTMMWTPLTLAAK